MADINNRYADKLGIVFTFPENLQEIYLKLGIDLTRFNGNDLWQLPMSGRFLIDSSGIIRSVDVHPDHTIRPEPDEIIDFMKSLT